MSDVGGSGEALALIVAGVGVLGLVVVGLMEGMDHMAKRRRQQQSDDPPPESPKPADPPPDIDRDPDTGDREAPDSTDDRDEDPENRLELDTRSPLPTAARPRANDPPHGSGIWAPQSRTMWEWT